MRREQKKKNTKTRYDNTTRVTRASVRSAMNSCGARTKRVALTAGDPYEYALYRNANIFNIIRTPVLRSVFDKINPVMKILQ